MPRQVFTAGEILTAANMNDLSDQTVMVFADSAARGSAIPTPVEGMVTYLEDTNQVSAFNGSAFAPLGNILQVVSATTATATTTTSSTFQNTSLTATITPTSSSSKILVIAQGNVERGAVDDSVRLRLFRGNVSGTALGSAEFHTIYVQGTMFVNAPFSIVFVDSPATTSATQYMVGLRNTGAVGTMKINNFQQTMVLLEVAG
jgi:hypothetical protein